MPLFRVTVKQMKLTGGIRIEPGMSVDVVTNSKSEKVLWNYWNIVSYRGFSSERSWNFIFAVVLLWLHMFQDKFVFAQLVAFLDRSKFNRIVAKYNGEWDSSELDTV